MGIHSTRSIGVAHSAITFNRVPTKPAMGPSMGPIYLMVHGKVKRE
jgi:hypothetical protein